MALEKGSEETVGVKEIAFSTFGEAPIARLGYSLGLTDCLVGSSREGTVPATLAAQAAANLGPMSQDAGAWSSRGAAPPPTHHYTATQGEKDDIKSAVWKSSNQTANIGDIWKAHIIYSLCIAALSAWIGHIQEDVRRERHPEIPIDRTCNILLLCDGADKHFLEMLRAGNVKQTI